MPDPLTSIPGMIANIEPGFRLIDGLLLRALYIQHGDAAAAASIPAGYQMVDGALLRRLAVEIGATQTAQRFPETGPRLTDGSRWKILAEMAAGQIAPAEAEVAPAESEAAMEVKDEEESPPEEPPPNPPNPPIFSVRTGRNRRGQDD